MKLIFHLVVVFLASMAFARPQTQLKWNWEEVILSRNGPSTSTTPRPRSWATTTLRFLDVAPVVGAGSVGSVEDAFLVRRPTNRPLASSGPRFEATSWTSAMVLLLGCYNRIKI
jgi:hypothetical protein